MMTAMRSTCSVCGAELPPDAPRGLCPACLFQLNEATVAGPLSDSAASGGAAPFGTRRFGDYELLEEIARGGMGIVYRARQLSLDRMVAVKMILFGSLANAEQVRRFRVEATAAGSLQHPNIVAVHEVGLHEGQNFMVMDYVDGPNLSRLVQDQPLPAKKAAHYLKDIAEAVQFAHDRGILHRDLKPSNVLIGSDDRPRVTDFGLAKRFDAESSLTLSGHALGSPNYMPPEQAGGGRQKVGRTSDVYSLGAILYHLLTARPPFRAETINETLQQVQGSEPLSPRLLNQSVPRDLETICLKCLEKEPAKRYATARELADELDRFLKDEPIIARPVTRAERAWGWCRRKPVVASLAVTSALLLLVVAVGGPIAAYRINQERLLLRQSLYATDMRLASEALHEGAFNRARTFLTNHLPRHSEVDLRGFEWRYLAKAVQNSEPFQTLEGLAAPSGWEYTLLARSERFLYNESDGQLRAWDMTTWEAVPIVPPPQPASVQWQCDPSRGAAYAVDETQHTLVVYTLPKFETGSTLRLPGRVFKVTMSQDRRALAVGFQEGVGHRVLVWDLVQDTHIGPLGDFEAAISALAFSRDGTLLAASSTDGVSTIWDLKTRQPLPAPPTNASHAKRLEFTPDNKGLLSGSDEQFSVWDIGARQPLTIERPGEVDLCSFGSSPDAKFLVMRRGRGDLTLLDSRTLQLKGTLHGHRDIIWGIAFSPDGKLMASASQDQTARIWDLANQTEAGIVGGFDERICGVEFSPDSQNIVVIGGLGQIRIYHLATVLRRGLFAKIPRPEYFNRLAVSPDEERLATVTFGTAGSPAVPCGTVTLWDRKSRRTVFSQRFPRHGEEYPKLACSPDGERVAWVTGDALRIMRVDSEHRIQTTPIEGNREVTSISFSPDGREVAFGCGKQLMLFDVATGNLHPLVATDDEVLAVKYSPDGTRIAFGDRKGTLTFCERASGRLVSKKPRAHLPHVLDIDISPNGRVLATCGSDASTIKLWSVGPDGLDFKDTLHGHMGKVVSVSFSPDSTRLVSVSDDQTLKIWDPHRAAELATFYGHHDAVVAVQFAKNGRTIYSAGFDGEIHFWEAPPLTAIALH